MLTSQPISATEVVLRGPAALHEWREAHRMAVPGHEYMPRFRSGSWDGTWMPGRWCRQLPGGTYELHASVGTALRIVRDLEAPDAVTAAFSRQTAEAFLASHPRVGELRDYQRAAFLESVVRGWGRVALATNAGKGAVIALLAAFAASRAISCLILCDELSVYDALEGEIAAWAPDVRVHRVRAGAEAPPVLGVSLAMVPTLARRLDEPAWREWLGEQGMLLLDEADKATARKTWRQILKAATGSRWRIGFSGTFPTDAYEELVIDDLMGPTLLEQRNRDMIARGISARPTVELHSFAVTDALEPAPHEWWKLTGPARRLIAYERAVVTNPARHTFITRLVRPDTPTAIVVNRIDHGRALCDAFQGWAQFLDGSADEAERLEVLERFRTGELRVLIVTRILDRGTNRLGHAADLIFASAEGSRRQTLQRIGRGLRRAGGKEFLRLIDVIDRVELQGASRWVQRAAGYLHAAARQRVELYREEAFDVEVRRA